MLLLSLLVSLPACLPQQSEAIPARVSSDDTAIRCFYDKTSQVVALLPADTPVRVKAEKIPWARVEIPGGIDVWVHGDYVEESEGYASVKVLNLNARPLPNTSIKSQVVGVLKKGERMLVVGRDVQEDATWLQVRVREEGMGAWVLKGDLRFVKDDSAWQADWNAAALLREAVPEKPITPPLDEKAADESQGLSPETAESAASAETAPEKSDLFLSSDVAKDPHTHLLRAELALAEMAATVPENLSAFDSAALDNLEMVFGTVIWHSVDQADLDSSRLALGRVDALRRFHAAALAAAERRAQLGDEVKAAEAAAKAIAESKRAAPIDPLESYIEVGWLEFRPTLHLNQPYAVVRGGRSALVHSYDGRYNLRDFVGREVAVRGLWREAKKPGDPRVLAITELRVLPHRKPAEK